MSFKPTVLHLAGLAIFSYGYSKLSTLPIDALISQQKGGHFQFLTIQGLAVAWITLFTSILADLLPTFSVLRQTKRTLLLIALPLAVVISVIYWSLITLAPELIVMTAQPASTEPSSSSDTPAFLRIPLHIDLSLHAAPCIILLADFMLFQPRYSNNAVRYGGALVAISFAIFYANWVEYCAKYNGTFPYPFLTENPFEIRVGIYIGATLLAYTSMLGLNVLHSSPSPRKHKTK